MSRARVLLLLLFAALLSAACGPWRPATVPIRTVPVYDGGSGRCLMILLPGRFAAPETFVRGRFGEEVAARALDMDVVAVDAHLGYYRTRTVIDRIREDVVLPARARGYESIWIAGTSLGGLGSLLYLREHPSDLSGVLAIAAYLGDDGVIREIEAAGGPRNWPPPSTIAGDDLGRDLWSWLRTFPAGSVPVSLGWGSGDRFDHSNRMLASLLPASRVFVVEGAHDVATWREVWTRFLDASAPCGVAASRATHD